MSKNEALSYIKNFSLVLLSITAFLFPIFFVTTTTEIFILPKQLFIIGIALLLLIAFGTQTIVERKITVKSSPFNLPLVLLGVVILASALFSANMYDSLLQAVPVLMLLLMYIVVINMIDDAISFKILVFSLLGGGAVSALITVLSFLKIYIFPFAATQNQYFNTHGSVIQQIIYLVPLATLGIYHLVKQSKKGNFDYNFGFYTFTAVVMIVGVATMIYQIVTLPEKPIILPFMYGFQIALATISQETQRLLQSFLVGSGYGTFASDFTRFKPISFNTEQDLWSLVFSYSSSYFLELVATTGVLGTIAYLFLTLKVLRTKVSSMHGIYAALLVTLLMSYLLPFSYVSVFLLVMLLGLYTSYLYLNKHETVYEFTLSLIAWKESLRNLTMPGDAAEETGHHVVRKSSPYLPIGFTVLIVLLSGFIAFFTAKYALAENKFRNSLTTESLNSGQQTYDLQRSAIETFPYKSDYYRVFSQINLALANSVLNNQPQGSTPSAQTQQTVLGLLQQSINAGRVGAQLAPQTSGNWVQLSQVYRNLIGVGQNAESFAVASLQQAIRLDPLNPQLYIQLGGIYYQLELYEQAQNQFQLAVNLKPDLANAHYNLGHALEAKNDYQNALIQYELVRQLTVNDKENVKKITAEIEALKKKAGDKAEEVAGATDANIQPKTGTKEDLELSTPSAQLPARSEPIELPPPPATEESTESAR